MGFRVWTIAATALLVACSGDEKPAPVASSGAGGSGGSATAGETHTAGTGATSSSGASTGGGGSGQGGQLVIAGDGGEAPLADGGAGGALPELDCDIPTANPYDCSGTCPELGACAVVEQAVSAGQDRGVMLSASAEFKVKVEGPGLCVRIDVQPEAFFSILGGGALSGSCMFEASTKGAVTYTVLTKARGWATIRAAADSACSLACP